MKIKNIAMVLLAATMLSSVVQADDDEYEKKGKGYKKEQRQKNRESRQNMTIEEIKAKMNANVEKRIKKLQSMQSCINNATTKQDIRACKPKQNKQNKKNKKKRKNKDND